MKILHATPMEQNTTRQKGRKTKPFRAVTIANSSIWNSLKPFMR